MAGARPERGTGRAPAASLCAVAAGGYPTAADRARPLRPTETGRAVDEHREEETRMTSETETGGVTGTQDKDYNLIWYVEACLSNALRLESYIQDAERAKDTEVADLFRKAQADSRKGAELGKGLLRARLNGG
ncbi:hypothetical protein GCM10010297_18380 [Streptomyces malachitofuscus]|nr:hypothetical protein GCM10010297_18380 [Streptomyces malachitofuscus]